MCLGTKIEQASSWQVGDGYTDFVPSPAESRNLIASGYSVPQTLLLQFADDGIDETAAIAPSLRSRGRGALLSQCRRLHGLQFCYVFRNLEEAFPVCDLSLIAQCKVGMVIL